MAYSIPNIISWAKMSQSFAEHDLAMKAIRGGALDKSLPGKLYVERKSLEWEYEQDPTSTELFKMGNYVLSLCGTYLLKAQNVTVSGGNAITPTIPLVPTGVRFIWISAGDFANATDYVNTNLANIDLSVFANWVARYLVEGTEWEALAGGGIRILLAGFNSQSGDDYAIRIDLQGEERLVANTVDWNNVTGKPQSGVFYDLDADFQVPNRGAADPFSLITIKIKPNGFNYTWASQFRFGDNLPEQPSANANDTLQLYTFQYDDTFDIYVCVGQALNNSIV